MADIDLVPKHRSVAWVWWVIAAVVIVIALMWMMRGSRTTSGAPTSLQLAPQFDTAPANIAPMSALV
jgi:hypothetical protein